MSNVTVDTGYAEHWIATTQGNIYARDYLGASPAFVLMHGLPDNLHIYDDLVPYLVAGGRRVVVFDFLGFGRSEKPSAARYGFEQQRGDLLAVVESLQLGRIVPVAHDSSGPCAVNFAIEHPHHVAALCILNSVYSLAPGFRLPEVVELFATPTLGALALAMVQSPAQLGWALNFQRAQFKNALSEDQKAHYEATLGPLIDHNFTQQPSAGPAFAQMTSQLLAEVARNVARLDDVAALAIPVKFIWGAADPYLDRGLAEFLQSHMKVATLHVLAPGHWLQMDMPAEVAREMLA